MPKVKKTSKARKASSKHEVARRIPDDWLREHELGELARYLPSVYMMLAAAYVEAGGKLTQDILDDVLSALAFDTATLCEWITPPTYRPSPTRPVGSHSTSIGKWSVTDDFKTEFDRLLEEPIAVLTKMAAADQALRDDPSAIRWQRPTPKEHIDAFLSTKRHPSKLWLARQLAAVGYGVSKKDSKEAQFIKRLYREPTVTTWSHRWTIDGLSKLRRLVEIMRQCRPDLFSNLKMDDLVWTPEQQ